MGELVSYLKTCMVYASIPLMYLGISMLKLAYLVAPHVVLKGVKNMSNRLPGMEKILQNAESAADVNFFFSNEYIKANIKTLLNNINKTAAEGQPAVNVKLVNPDNGAQVNILDYANGTRARFENMVDFITVYIEEAHPSDEDHFKENIDIKTHQNLQVDRMDNAANKSYGAFPERLYAILDGEVVFAGGIGPFQYSLEELDTFLEIKLGKEKMKCR